MIRCVLGRFFAVGFLLAALGLSAPLSANKGTELHTPPASEEPNLTGSLLVAAPEMKESIFSKTVIYIARHTGQSTFGLVVNRPIGSSPVKDLLEGFGLKGEGVEGHIPIHFGGPVDPSAGFVLHSTDQLYDGDMEVNEAVAVNVELDILRDIAAGKGPRKNLFVLGYTGWGPGQLESELRRGNWVVVPYDEQIVFGDDFGGKTKWQRALDLRTIDL